MLEFYKIIDFIAKIDLLNFLICHCDLLRVLVMLKHSNSAVTSVTIQNCNFIIYPNIPITAPGNVWDSLQAGDPQVA